MLEAFILFIFVEGGEYKYSPPFQTWEHCVNFGGAFLKGARDLQDERDEEYREFVKTLDFRCEKVIITPEYTYDKYEGWDI